jgi:hypothetical protein
MFEGGEDEDEHEVQSSGHRNSPGSGVLRLRRENYGEASSG